MLAKLRDNLDFAPSPVGDQPGLMIRDHFRYSDAVVIIPPALVPYLQYFDGQHTGADLRDVLVRAAGDIRAVEVASRLTEALSHHGFLEDAIYQELRETSHREFAESIVRQPAHSGSGYPDDIVALQDTMRSYMDSAPTDNGRYRDLIGIAAPHVSPFGGWRSYRAAYRLLRPELRERTFVILGTSHYGEPDRFGLTRKPFATPFGQTTVAVDLIDRLEREAGDAVLMEDYCHSMEHSIEFQVLFLQWIYGADVRILPILCGSYARSIYLGGKPEANPAVERFLNVLGEIAARESKKLFWVLGIDMAHMGRRYGDSFTAIAEQGEMAEVRSRDELRIGAVHSGDSHGFWNLVQQGQDDLKWCGSSPLYTFLKAAPHARGVFAHYEQWNIDEESVVSFAGMGFSGTGA